MAAIFRKFLLCIGLIATMTGCASVGGNFKYENISQLKLGDNAALDYKTIFGKPRSRSMVTNPDGDYENVRFLYAHANLAVAQSRLLDLEFRNGVLNAYFHISSFDADRTNVNNGLWGEIKSGQTTKDEVLSLLGEPHGKALCPSNHVDFKEKCKDGKEIWVWCSMSKLSTFGAAYGSQKVRTKTLFAVFDENGIVVNVYTTESD